MAIKIIKPGVIPNKDDKVFDKTCNNCGCEFQYSQSDIISTTAIVLVVSYIKCPTCNKSLYVKI
jgi:hypothetical protein